MTVLKKIAYRGGHRRVVLGRTSYTLKAGGHARVALKLTARGRQILGRKTGRKKVSARIVIRTSKTATRANMKITRR